MKTGHRCTGGLCSKSSQKYHFHMFRIGSNIKDSFIKINRIARQKISALISQRKLGVKRDIMLILKSPCSKKKLNYRNDPKFSDRTV